MSMCTCMVPPTLTITVTTSVLTTIIFPGHDSRPPEPIRRIYRRRSQSELFCPVLLVTETAAAAAGGTALAAAMTSDDGDVKPLMAAGGHGLLTNGDVTSNGGQGLKPAAGAAGANSDTDADKKEWDCAMTTSHRIFFLSYKQSGTGTVVKGNGFS